MCRLRIGLLASVLQPQVYTERCVACLSNTSDPCACRTWPELATPPPCRRSVATCGRSHLCFRGAHASGWVLTSAWWTWLGVSELQPNKYIPHTLHACASSLPSSGRHRRALSLGVRRVTPPRWVLRLHGDSGHNDGLNIARVKSKVGPRLKCTG